MFAPSIAQQVVQAHYSMSGHSSASSESSSNVDMNRLSIRGAAPYTWLKTRVVLCKVLTQREIWWKVSSQSDSLSWSRPARRGLLQ